MKATLKTILAGTAVLSVAVAAPLESWRPLKARYTIFSGPILAGREAPTATDRKLTVLVEGQAAKEIFDFIGPDNAPVCRQEKGDRERAKQGVQCTYTAQGVTKGYECWIGIDLRTGRNISTVSC